MIGKRFGRWIVLERNGSRRYPTYTVPLWICKCDCGTEKTVTGSSLRNGGSLSCGCLNDEIIRNQGTRKEEMIGKRFGRLVVKDQVFKSGKTGTLWSCECDCGNESVVGVMLLKKGKTTSCGCYNREIIKQKLTKHSLTSHPCYGVWKQMINRCTNENSISYVNYGGRGVKVCERWNDIQCFIDDMGIRPSKRHSLDRIDNNGDYCPENCKWSTIEEQMSNTRRKSNTGIVGVSYIKKRNKYSAYISYDKKQVQLGCFITLEEAIEARKQAEIKYWSSN